MRSELVFCALLTLIAPAPRAAPVRAPHGAEASAFAIALEAAENALAENELDRARGYIERALERDAKSPRAWAVRARWAEKAGDRDELVYALHRQLRLSVAQKAPRGELDLLREQLFAVDPIAKELLGLNSRFLQKLLPIAEQYEKEGRSHSAIRVHKEILALDPEAVASQVAIDRISAQPDPSLAGDAKPKDLLEGVSEEWIREHDAKHATWDDRAKLERENYTTYSDAGYATLVRCAEAMEQMNAFYREFFRYGSPEDKKSVGRIDLLIFKTRDEYLKKGSGPPADWSGGQFTGGSVETYVDGQGFETMAGVLFHESAHQFVSLATNAAGWLNEGLASFFEGCQILGNGTVLMNLPASERLFELAGRMEKGWMSSAGDGIDPKEPSKSNPPKAPTFRIVLENEYEWGPPWYGPTWGVVYFLYNYQDPVDGRFVYRDSFWEFVNSSGGRVGKGAVKNFEEVVLANPLPPIAGFERPPGSLDMKLPRTIAEVDPVWKEWMIALRDEQMGKLKRDKPYLLWARAALVAGRNEAAKEHFEKGLVITPEDPVLLNEFADFLAAQKNPDRAAKLLTQALRVLESQKKVDEKLVAELDSKLAKWDPKRATLAHVHEELTQAANALVKRYEDAKLPMMVMDVSWRLGTDLEVQGLFEHYDAALRSSGKTLQIWELAYDEKGFEGWDAQKDSAFQPAGPFIESRFGEFSGDKFDFQMLTLNRVSGGDFSLEVDVQADRGRVNFCGLVFGRKDATNFHALVLFPGKVRAKKEGEKESAVADSGWVDLASFYGSSQFKTWRHSPIAAAKVESASMSETWHKLRIDVAGAVVDAWCDGELLATQEFPSADVLRGTFGLITGPGAARYKEARFMARHPRDPAAVIERTVRMEKIRAKGGAGGGPMASLLGQLPPWPKVGRWVQGSRASWEEKGPVPQLFVLWSIQQNDIIPIDHWLADVAERFASSGLEVVSVTSPNDADKIEAYLKEHPFPGAVALDHRAGIGIGDTNEMYSTLRFNLPRILILDIDQKVAWEGDPGLSALEPWKSGVETYVDTPLAELVERRKLSKLAPWIQAWTKRGVDALHRGDLATALPLLEEARDYDSAVLPLVYDVQRKLQALESATSDLLVASVDLRRQERDPAIPILVDWARLQKVEISKKLQFDLKPLLESTLVAHWDRALKQTESYRERLKRDPALVGELIAKLEALKGVFPRELAEKIRANAADPAALDAELISAPEMPRLWLAQQRFGW